MEWFAWSSKFYIDLDDRGVSERAQMALARLCAYSADNETGGIVAKSALKRLGLSAINRRIDELLRHELIVESDDGYSYRIPAWLKWNEPLERQVKKRKADRERIAEKRSSEENVARQSRNVSRDVASPHNSTHTDTSNSPSPVPPVSNASAKRGRGLQIADSLNETARPIEVYRFMHDYEQSRSSPVDQKTLAGIENAVTPLIASGIPVEQVAAGLRLWESSDSFSPTQIAAYVHKAGSPRPGKASTTDERVRAAQALKRGTPQQIPQPFGFERKEIQA